MRKRIISIMLSIMMLILSVPMTSFAAEKEEMSDAFKAILNEDGKFVIPSVEPTTEEEILMYVSQYVWWVYHKKGISANYATYDPVKKTCDVTLKGETHNVEILFDYDKEVKKEAQKVIDSFPEEVGPFYVKDMELIHYWLTRTGSYEHDRKIAGLNHFSNEIKELIGNNKFSLVVDIVGGTDDDEFLTDRVGMAYLVHDEVAYYENEYVETFAKHVLYVPTETGDTKEELLAAIQKRVDDFAGAGKVKIRFGGTGVSQIMTDWAKRFINVENAAGDYWFIATINDVDYKFIIVKDSDAFTLPEISIEHTYPATMKVGEVFKEEYYVNVYGLVPEELYIFGGGSGLPIYKNGYWFNGGYGECGGRADAYGRILKQSNSDWMVYKPGEVKVEVSLSDMDYQGKRTYIPATIMVEEPIITHNAPKKVKAGDKIDFKTAITNTAYENKKQSEYYHLYSQVFYVPTIQVIEGTNLVKQSKQDYTDTLKTSEKLSFTGSGTVKLKISYMPTVYKVHGPDEVKDGKLESLTDGVIEEVVTIVVEGDKPVVSVPDDSEDDEPEDTTMPDTGTSETPFIETEEQPSTEDDYVVEFEEEKKVISKIDFEFILSANKDKDVVIQSSADLIFTFIKGSMSEVDDMEDYDFGTSIETEYEAKVEYGEKVNESNFVSRINFNYEGKLPGMASIRIHVGMEKKGLTLHYSKLCDDGTIQFIYSAVVDKDGYITVQQDSCSDYILTTERVDDEAEKEMESEGENNAIKIPATDDKNFGEVVVIIVVFVVIAVIVAVLFFVLKKKGWNLHR